MGFSIAVDSVFDKSFVFLEESDGEFIEVAVTFFFQSSCFDGVDDDTQVSALQLNLSVSTVPFVFSDIDDSVDDLLLSRGDKVLSNEVDSFADYHLTLSSQANLLGGFAVDLVDVSSFLVTLDSDYGCLESFCLNDEQKDSDSVVNQFVFDCFDISLFSHCVVEDFSDFSGDLSRDEAVCPLGISFPFYEISSYCFFGVFLFSNDSLISVDDLFVISVADSVVLDGYELFLALDDTVIVEPEAAGMAFFHSALSVTSVGVETFDVVPEFCAMNSDLFSVDLLFLDGGVELSVDGDVCVDVLFDLFVDLDFVPCYVRLALSVSGDIQLHSAVVELVCQNDNFCFFNVFGVDQDFLSVDLTCVAANSNGFLSVGEFGYFDLFGLDSFPFKFLNVSDFFDVNLISVDDLFLEKEAFSVEPVLIVDVVCCHSGDIFVCDVGLIDHRGFGFRTFADFDFVAGGGGGFVVC